jgi:hypothetical protein
MPGGAKPGDPLVTTGMIRRAEMRRQLKVAQQLKVATMTLVAVLLIAAYPVYILVRSQTQDPVFGDLDSLNLPSWADTMHTEAAAGSRWCIKECRVHSRTYTSDRGPDETNAAYVAALTDAGWRIRTTPACPTTAEGVGSCWERDEYVMDMWVRAPICEIPPPRATGGPSASPSPVPDSTAETTTPGCPGALVTMKVYNAISYYPHDLDPEQPPTGTPGATTPKPSGSPKPTAS